MPLLSVLIFLPIVGAIFILATCDDNNPQRTRVIALFTMVLSLVLCVPLYTHFDFQTYSMQFTEQHVWMPLFNVNYHLGIDGISMPLILLTTFTTFIVILATWRSIEKRVAQYFAAFLIMQGLMVGVFAALDAICRQ